MRYKWTQYLIWLVLLLPVINLAQIPQRPDPPKLVNDFANILTPSEQYILEDSLLRFERMTSNQIVVVTVPSLEGYDPGDFAFRIGESWGVGQKDKNNGIVVLVKPKTPNEQGRVYISVGYGLEGVIPDAVANGKIIDNEMIPRFRENDYFGGIMNGVRIIMDLSRGEYTAEQYNQGHGENSTELPMGGLVFFIFLIIIILAIFKGGGKNKTFNTGSRSLPFWILLGMMNSRGRGGSWSDFSGGRGGFGGGFGGGGGGGFGGFGGGGFGGGGAGGSW